MKISLEPNQDYMFEAPELRIKFESIDDILIMMHIGNISLNHLQEIIRNDSFIAVKPLVVTDDFQAIYNHLRNYFCDKHLCTTFSL